LLCVLEAEAWSIVRLVDRADDRFSRGLDILAECTGTIAVAGMGKSGIICKKIAATLSSTGSPAIFLHAAEAVHGDLGFLALNDVVLVVSKSGETPEVLQTVNVATGLRRPLVGLAGNPLSKLARHADVSLDVSVADEACPLGLAPTTSTAAALAMGDALAMALMERKGFRQEDFASVHPAGAIGKKLLSVEELMQEGASVPKVLASSTKRAAIYELHAEALA